MKGCVTGKKIYPTREVAEDALIEARTRYEFSDGQGPVAVYLCDDCGQYHLTSRGPVNEKLARAINEGKISLQKEANKWLDKLNRK